MREEKHLEKCVAEIVKKLNWGEPKTWLNQDFHRLSEIFQEKTNISLSAATLKYIFGKTKRPGKTYNPQPSTKEAIARYLGYRGWSEYLEQENQPGKMNLNPGFIIMGLSGIVLIVLSFLSIKYIRSLSESPNSTPASISFQVLNPVGEAPHTARFQYNVKGGNTDTFWVDYDYYHQEVGLLSRQMKYSSGTFSFCYQVPGIYRVNLMRNKSLAAQRQIMVKSKGWIGFAVPRIDYKATPAYKNTPLYKQPVLNTNIYKIQENPFVNKKLYIPPEKVNNSGVDTGMYWTVFGNIQDFGQLADSSVFEVVFRNNKSTGGITCYDSYFSFLCDSGNISIMLVGEGCSHYASVEIGKEKYPGHSNNLSALEFDPDQLQTLRVDARENRIQIFLNNENIFHKQKGNVLGQLKGMEFRFKGSGEVQDVILSSKDEEMHRVLYDKNKGAVNF